MNTGLTSRNNSLFIRVIFVNERDCSCWLICCSGFACMGAIIHVNFFFDLFLIRRIKLLFWNLTLINWLFWLNLNLNYWSGANRHILLLAHLLAITGLLYCSSLWRYIGIRSVFYWCIFTFLTCWRWVSLFLQK